MWLSAHSESESGQLYVAGKNQNSIIYSCCELVVTALNGSLVLSRKHILFLHSIPPSTVFNKQHIFSPVFFNICLLLLYPYSQLIILHPISLGNRNDVKKTSISSDTSSTCKLHLFPFPMDTLLCS